MLASGKEASTVVLDKLPKTARRRYRSAITPSPTELVVPYYIHSGLEAVKVVGTLVVVIPCWRNEEPCKRCKNHSTSLKQYQRRNVICPIPSCWWLRIEKFGLNLLRKYCCYVMKQQTEEKSAITSPFGAWKAFSLGISGRQV